jgi:hypothetical protein
LLGEGIAVLMQRFSLSSIPTVVLIFLLLGPLLWPLSLLVVGSVWYGELSFVSTGLVALVFSVPSASFLGGILWWWAAFHGNLWLGTWIPTIISALVYSLVISTVCEKPNVTFKSRLQWIAFNGLVCAVISAIVFLVMVGVSWLVETDMDVMSRFSKLFRRQVLSHAWIAVALWVMVVALTGAILGMVVAVLARAETKNAMLSR